MKRFLLLTFVGILSFVGCSSSPDEETITNSTTTSTSNSTTAATTTTTDTTTVTTTTDTITANGESYHILEGFDYIAQDIVCLDITSNSTITAPPEKFVYFVKNDSNSTLELVNCTAEFTPQGSAPPIDITIPRVGCQPIILNDGYPPDPTEIPIAVEFTYNLVNTMKDTILSSSDPSTTYTYVVNLTFNFENATLGSSNETYSEEVSFIVDFGNFTIYNGDSCSPSPITYYTNDDGDVWLPQQ